jgi:hypothetical protein
MDELQRGRWLWIMTITQTVLGEAWLRRLIEAAAVLEAIDAKRPLQGLPKLLSDLYHIQQDNPETIGITPDEMVDQLKEFDAEWDTATTTSVGRLLHRVQRADGSQLESVRVAIAERPRILGFEPMLQAKQKNFRAYLWADFEATWAAYRFQCQGSEGHCGTNYGTT